VKRIPNPIASVGGISSGGMNAATFRAQIAPAARLDNFDFDAQFKVVGFTFMMLPKGKDIVGPYVDNNNGGCRFTDNPDIQKAMGRARAGDRVFIEEIKAVGPDGQRRTLPVSISLSLN
jgi:hypothetical protein